MPEYLRALIVVLAIAMAVFSIVRKPATEIAISDEEFRRWRNLWFATTLIAFLSHNFWVYAVACGFLFYSYGKRDTNPLALFFMLLFAVPSTVSKGIPGIGPIDHIFVLSHARILTLAVLLPLALNISRKASPRTERWRAPDLLVAGYIIITLIAQARDDSTSIVNLLRFGIYALVDVWIPYYVASRAVTSVHVYRRIATVLVIALSVMAATGIFEMLRGWLLYANLTSILGKLINLYSRRGDEGLLRATVTEVHSINFGYCMVVAIAMYLFARQSRPASWGLRLIAMIIAGGLLASLSRGPWVAGVAVIIIFSAFAPSIGSKIKMPIGLALLLSIFFVITPLGEQLLDFLPWIGTSAKGSLSYREQLFRVSMEVFWQHPILGDPYYLEDPLMETMRQGQGIIDMVNTYLQIALPYGAVGLACFLGCLLLPTWAIFKVLRGAKNLDPEVRDWGRSQLAAMAGIILTIATTSNTGNIQLIYWLFVGLSVGFLRGLGGVQSPHKESRSDVTGRSQRLFHDPHRIL